jgi:putative transposase
MTETKQEAVAYFRYALIHPMLAADCTGAKRREYLRQTAAREHDIPYSNRRHVSEGMLLAWFHSYRRYGIDALKPKGRSDSGGSRKIGTELGAALLLARREHPEQTITAVAQRVEREHPELCHGRIPAGSLYRFFSRNQDALRTMETADRRRFEFEWCNDCWMVDATDGPKALVSGLKWPKTVYCFGAIDDKSRLVCHAEFYPDQKAESLLDCLWKAFNKRGLPRMILTDNGSAMRDARLKLGCAELEIHLSYSRPYRPQGKAKIERFWSTLQMQFFPTLPPEPLTLFELNQRLGRYVDMYNKRVHSSIGMAPLERFLDDLKMVRPAPAQLPRMFRNRIERTVSLARTVSLGGRLYEVPMGYGGRKIELRYFDTSGIEAFHEGRSIGFLRPVDLVANSNAHRGGKEVRDGQ